MTVVRLLVILILVCGQQAEAIVRVNITGGQDSYIPIAIGRINGLTGEELLYGDRISSVINNNLKLSGLFEVINKERFSGFEQKNDVAPNFGLWRGINSYLLMTASISIQQNTMQQKVLMVDFRLWDIHSNKEIVSKSYKTELESWRRVSHLISDDIYSTIGGERGYFDTRIVYISEYGDFKNRKKRLAIMDQDGANHRFLSDGSVMELTPRFSPNRQQITYLSYKDNLPKVYIYNLETQESKVIGHFPGITFAPRFSSDNRYVVLSASMDGNSEIYEVDLMTNTRKRLTNSIAIDTSPYYSPGDKHILFNSDRGGSPQLYIMDRDGSNVRRISYGKGVYTAPAWSPRGDLIAFTKQYKGNFHIGTMDTNGKNEKLLTTSFMDEGPTWSPNGRVIMFTRQSVYRDRAMGSTSIYAVDITGKNLRRIFTPQDASDPAWSPLLKTTVMEE